MGGEGDSDKNRLEGESYFQEFIHPDLLPPQLQAALSKTAFQLECVS